MHRLFLLTSLSMFLIACGDKAHDDRAYIDSVIANRGRVPTAPPADTTLRSMPAPDTSAATRRYDVKSGVVEFTLSSDAQQRITAYFDDYGAREAIYSVGSFVAQDGRQMATTEVQIYANGSLWRFDPNMKIGTVRAWGDEGGLSPISSRYEPSRLTADERAQLGYKELPPRTIAGKQAEGYEMTIDGATMRVWSWKGIPLQWEATSPQLPEPVVTTAKSVTVDLPIAAEKFAVPKDVALAQE